MHYLVKPLPGFSLDDTIHEITLLGCTFYIIEDESQHPQLGIIGPPIENPKTFKIFQELPEEVNWDAQMPPHARNLGNGWFEIEALSERLLLKSGEAFGDLSHPTTLLCAQTLFKLSPKDKVIDVGCGSGILLMLASRWGSTTLVGIENNLASVAIAKENFRKNRIQASIYTELRDELFDVGILNMTLKEGATVISTFQDTLFNAADTWILSGLLEHQQEKAMKPFLEEGFTLSDRADHGQWVCITLKKIGKKDSTHL